MGSAMPATGTCFELSPGHKVERGLKFNLCAYSSADKSTGLRNRGSWVQIPLGALSESSLFGNIFI
jgi:hypothetical protein